MDRFSDGLKLGTSDGCTLGIMDGLSDGFKLGTSDGCTLGISEGINDGNIDGLELGLFDIEGNIDGFMDGAQVENCGKQHVHCISQSIS
mmetsp:Transcript_16466/g.24279  ORF Transcript_16466/g.24279 Transcript_16466/m.24279 type:complete len:89 (-) Transcript_16466:334-600(-)